MPTWFLPPDFTFAADGPIQLGTVIAHPKRPTQVLATLGSPGSGITPMIDPKPNPTASVSGRKPLLSSLLQSTPKLAAAQPTATAPSIMKSALLPNP
jgi:hypothetical protein